MERISSSRYSIRQIFQEHWGDYYFKHKDTIPDYVTQTVEKMLNCCNPEKLGYHKYACPEHPNQYIVVPHSCKSRFCNRCGKVLTDKWVERIEKDFPPTPFHHICFTLPDTLRELLNRYRFLRHSLFIASSQTLLSFSRQQGFLPAMICGFHSFGRDLKDNPHIHMLITAGGISLKGKRRNRWKSSSYIPFKMLHKRYRYLLIKDLKRRIKEYLKEHPEEKGELKVFSDPKVLDTFFDPELKKNWYVHDSEELPAEKFTVSYIVRYTKRPPLAEYKILDYFKKGKETFVTFSYKERTRSPVKWTIQVERFIGLLIQHIPEKNFRQVRYYGALAKKNRPLFKKVLSKLSRKMKEKVKFTSWRERQKAFTGRDPFLCPVCGKEMELTKIAYFSKAINDLVYRSPP